MKFQKVQPTGCLGKLSFTDETTATKRSLWFSRKHKVKYKVYKCPWCTKTELKSIYHLATVKTNKKKTISYLEYARFVKPIVAGKEKQKDMSFFKKLRIALKKSYNVFISSMK